jgi:hypothetical protein
LLVSGPATIAVTRRSQEIGAFAAAATNGSVASDSISTHGHPYIPLCVLFERGDVYFYFGLSDPRAKNRLTTNELAEAATRIADVVFG